MIRLDHAIHSRNQEASLRDGLGIYSLSLYSNFFWLVLVLTSVVLVLVLLTCSLRTSYFQESHFINRAKEFVQQPLLTPTQDSLLLVEAGSGPGPEPTPSDDGREQEDDLNSKPQLAHSMSSLSLHENESTTIPEPNVIAKTKEFSEFSELVLSKSESLDEACTRLESREKCFKANRSVDEILGSSQSEVSPGHVLNPIKSRKLQERRGSNHSLTIAVKPADNTLPTVITPRECSAAQFLLTAGNCMTRRQLRACLGDVKSLHAEFWSIPTNAPDLLELVSGCALKNRYRYVLPNPLSRVQLPSKDPSDPSSGYINANYIRGPNGEARAYIATQGPLANTIGDFWLMVWTEKSPAIIMITKLVESRNTKCEPYLPEVEGQAEEVLYEDIYVSVVHVEEKDGYTIRQLSLRRGDEVRQLVHYWYSDWPDHKTPENPQTLVELATTVMGLYRQPNSTDQSNAERMGPIIVHCSAGVGRTGAFIAVCQGLSQLVSEDQVDILGIVCALRCDRGGMVQTAEQYEFIHRGLCLFQDTI